MQAFDNELLALRRTFYEEADERLSEVESLLLDLERRPDDPDLLNTIFRAVHSVKGGAAACEHTELASFAHAFESLLACLRKGQLAITARLLDVLLNATDVLKSLLSSAKDGRSGGEAAAVERALTAIRAELAELPPTEEASGPKVDLSQGLVIWDDEPATPVVITSSPRSLTSSAAPSDGGSVVVQRRPAPSDAAMPAGASAPAPSEPASAGPYTPYTRSYPPPRAPSRIPTVQPPSMHAAQASEPAPQARGAELLTRDATSQRVSRASQERLSHAPEGAHRAAVAPTADYPLESVVVRVGEQLYGLETAHVEGFLQPAAGALREVPLQGPLLLTERGLLPLARLEVLLGRAPDPKPIEQRVAVVVSLGARRSALLVDEVLTQGSLLVKRIEPNFRHVPGVAGASLIDDQLALVLSLAALLGN